MGTQRRRQQGMGFWSLLLVLLAIALVVLVGLKLFPIYMESFKVQSALDKVIQQDDIKTAGKMDIYQSFLRYMSIEDVDRFNRKNLRELMDIDRKDKQVTITLEYSARAKLVDNLSIVADWKKVVSTRP